MENIATERYEAPKQGKQLSTFSKVRLFLKKTSYDTHKVQDDHQQEGITVSKQEPYDCYYLVRKSKGSTQLEEVVFRFQGILVVSNLPPILSRPK